MERRGSTAAAAGRRTADSVTLSPLSCFSLTTYVACYD